MSKLKGIGLQNFRGFKDEVFFEFAPITILTGTNSSGKSSIFKALLLLQDNYVRNQLEELSFEGDKHNLGSFENTICQFRETDENFIVFRLSQSNYSSVFETEGLSLYLLYKQNGEKGWLDRLVLADDSRDEVMLEYRIEEDGEYVYFKFNLDNVLKKISKDVQKRKEEEKNVKKIDMSKVRFLHTDKLNLLFDSSMKYELGGNILNVEKILQHQNLSEEEIEYLRTILIHQKTEFLIPISFFDDMIEFDITFYKTINLFFSKNDNLPNIWLNFNEEKLTIQNLLDGISDEERNNYKKIIKNLEKIGNVLIEDIIEEDFIDFFENELHRKFTEEMKNIRSLVKKMDYLEAVRANTQRVYTNQSQGTSFNQLLLDFSKYSFYEKSSQILFINHWLREFGIAEEIKIERLKGVATLVLIKKGDKWVDLADFGYGVSQVLPILLKIAISNGNMSKKDLKGAVRLGANDILLLEEPETNLHPKLQSKIADMLMDARKRFFIDFMIETHSEYLIRKLQYLVAKKELQPQDVTLYYLYEPDKIPEGEPQVKKLEIMPDGSLSDDFGEGFFDEATKWKFELLKLKNQN